MFMLRILSVCALLVGGVASAQDAPAVPLPLDAQPVNNSGAPTTSYVPPTTDTQVALPPLPAPQTQVITREGQITEDDQPGYEHTAPTYNGEHEYFSFLGSYVIPDGGRGTTRRGGSASWIYGHLFTDRLSIEVDPTISIFNTGKSKGTDFYQYGGTVDMAYAFTSRMDAKISPFVLAGLGTSYEDVQPGTGKKFSLNADAGLGLVTKPLFYGVKLRAEGRYIYDFHNEFRGGGFHDYRASVGIEIPLGRVIRTATLQQRPVEMVQLVPQPWIDSDGDGVDDAHDKCPNTPKGFKVDAEGCIIPGQSIVLRGITFEFNKDRLTPNARAVLDAVMPAFTGQRSLRVEIAGHTDSIGSVAYNEKLSQRRADAVRAYLISQGAHDEQVVAKGYGKSQLLINPEKNADDRELNRRVEFRVMDK